MLLLVTKYDFQQRKLSLKLRTFPYSKMCLETCSFADLSLLRVKRSIVLESYLDE